MSKRKAEYKLCELCDQPILNKGQKRQHPDDYRHAAGCPAASPEEQKRWYRKGGLFQNLPRLKT